MSFVRPYIEAAFNEAIMSRLGSEPFLMGEEKQGFGKGCSLKLLRDLRVSKSSRGKWVRNSFSVSKKHWLWTVFRPEVPYRSASPVSDVEL